MYTSIILLKYKKNECLFQYKCQFTKNTRDIYLFQNEKRLVSIIIIS